MPLISASSLNSRFVQLAGASFLLLTLLWFLVPGLDIRHAIPVPSPPWTRPSHPSRPRPDHPIDHLIREADKELDALLAKEMTTLDGAAHAYRVRRGRNPPPAFDVWFAFAQNHSALIVEDFFDQIYHDLAPFWGVPAKQIREQANQYEFLVQVRDGKASQRTDQQRPWMDLWTNLTGTISQWLPDVDVPINEMDESRMVVPWEEIDGYMTKEQEGRPRPKQDWTQLVTKQTYGSLKSLDEQGLPVKELHEYGYKGEGPYWDLYAVGCPPDSAPRKAPAETDFSQQPPPLPTGWPAGSYKGYVANWTRACSPCANAHLRGLHGTFVEPISISTTATFFPLFGGSKLPMNNEILLPPAMYWTTDPFYSGGEEHGGPWARKKDQMVWRGAASGGRNTEANWRRFQRHRFVSMVNGSAVEQAEKGEVEAAGGNFVLPSTEDYPLAARNTTDGLAGWVKRWSDAAVVHLLCFGFPGFDKYCPYTNPFYTVAKATPMKEQYGYKYLPDIDGNSFSGRYRGFLGSTSLPIKATIYKEWHDSRLVPWKHFVPMDNTFADVYGIMEYFVGNKEAGVEGHDDVAEGIAMGGKAWAERVLRREDMLVYVMRLLLEYARVCDEKRDGMGWLEGASGGVT